MALREAARSSAKASVVVLLGLLGSCGPGVEEPRELTGGRHLVPGLEETQGLAEGGSVRYRASLRAGDVLHLVVEQQELDLEIRFPNGERSGVDHPYGILVDEELWWLAEVDQELRLEIRSLEDPLGSSLRSGSFRLEVRAMEPAASEAERCQRAFWWIREGIEAFEAGELQEARKRFMEALDLGTCDASPLQEPMAWSALAQAQSALGDPQAALASHDRAISSAEASGQPALESRIRHARGRLYRQQWSLEPAESDFLLARDRAEAAGDTYAEALLANDLAVLHAIRGELAAACEGYHRAHQLFLACGFVSQATQAQIKSGSCLTQVGDMAAALPLLLEGKQAAEKLGNPDLQVLALRDLGWWYRLSGNTEAALQVLRDAFKLAPESSGTNDRLGTVYSDQGNLDKARDHYHRTLQKVSGDSLETAFLRANLCRLEQLAQDPDSALGHCEESLRVLERLGADGAMPQVLLLLARLEGDRGQLERAEKYAARAVGLVEAQRPLAGEERMRSAFLAERLAPHRLLVELRMALHEADTALGWDRRALESAELTRERGLLDLLQAERVDPVYRADPALKREEGKLLYQIERLARFEAARVTGEQPADPALRSQRTALEAELAAVRRQLRLEAPSYVSLRALAPADPAVIQRLLDSETVLLAYHLSGDSGFVWALSRETLEGQRLDDPRQLSLLAETWSGLLSDAELGWVDPGLERDLAQQLTEALLGPVQRELEGRRRLVVVASGILQRIPFAALPHPLRLGREDRPLAADLEVVHLPSVAALSVLRRQSTGRRAADGLMAIVADPVFGPDDERLEVPVAVPPKDPPWPRLPGSAREAAELVALARGRPTLILEGFGAQRERILQGAIEGFRIVVFATHARTQGGPGKPPGLVLSLYEEDGSAIDGWIGLPELYALDLPAELAVLSACGTGRGEEVPGDGLLGLTRGFMHAGTPRVVVSLWPVQDEASQEFSRRFISALLQDGRPAAALRHAQRAMWAGGWPTRDWAAYILQGDWSTFPVQSVRS